MKSKTIRKLFFGIVLFVFPSLLFAQESLTITTYYPSPAGSYQDLEVVNLLTVNTNIMAGPAAVATNPFATINAAMSTAAGNGQPARMAVLGRHTGNANTFGGVGASVFTNLASGIGNARYYTGVYAQEPAAGVGFNDNTYAGIFWGDVYVAGNIRGPNLGLGVVQCSNYGEGASLAASYALCPAGTYAIACGSGSCANPGGLDSPGGCPGSGYMLCISH